MASGLDAPSARWEPMAPVDARCVRHWRERLTPNRCRDEAVARPLSYAGWRDALPELRHRKRAGFPVLRGVRLRAGGTNASATAPCAYSEDSGRRAPGPPDPSGPAVGCAATRELLAAVDAAGAAAAVDAAHRVAAGHVDAAAACVGT